METAGSALFYCYTIMNDNMNRPNLFRIATSELSQDAFLVWLIQWADPSTMQYDPALCTAGQDFIRLLISKQYDDFSSEIQKVEAGRQWKNIDVWAKVNDKFLIVIEDKTGTGVHSGQLDRCRKTVEEHCASENLIPVYIYIKTQDESKARATYAKGKGYGIYGLTNWSAETFPIAYSRYPVLHQFDGTVVSGQERLIKPDPMIFNVLLKRYGLDAGECIFIDDSKANIEAAGRLGFNTVLFDNIGNVTRQISALTGECGLYLSRL